MQSARTKNIVLPVMTGSLQCSMWDLAGICDYKSRPATRLAACDIKSRHKQCTDALSSVVSSKSSKLWLQCIGCSQSFLQRYSNTCRGTHQQLHSGNYAAKVQPLQTMDASATIATI